MEIDYDKLEKLCEFLEKDDKVKEVVKKIISEKPDLTTKLITYYLSNYIRKNPDKLVEVIKDIEKKEEPKRELPVLPKEVVDANLTDAEKKIYYMLLEKAKGKRRSKK